MKANNHIDEGLLDNEKHFSDEFFKQFTLRTAPQPLSLTDDIHKDYLFPTFYGDVTCAIGVFLCDFDKAQAMLPHPKMKPVRMPKNRALVTFSCYQYKKVLGVSPYNEIAMTIPLLVDPKVNVPVLPMIAEGLFTNFGYHVFHMPVTSLENKIRGRKIWGLPKVVDDIDIQVDHGFSTTVATDDQGNDYFSLSVPVNGQATEFNVCSQLYSQLDNQLLQSETRFKATFKVNKYMDRLFKQGGSDPGYLKLGEGPYADMLRRLEIEPQPFQFRYASSMNACFDLPNQQYQAPFTFK